MTVGDSSRPIAPMAHTETYMVARRTLNADRFSTNSVADSAQVASMANAFANRRITDRHWRNRSRGARLGVGGG